MMSLDGRLVDDDRNKAILMRSENGLLSITFAGVGALAGGVRMDRYIVDQLQNAGIAELNVEDAIPAIAQAGAQILSQVHASNRHHSFVVAAYSRNVQGVLVPRLWKISNYAGSGTPAGDTFEPVEIPTPNAIATGLLSAIPESDKAQLEAEGRQLNDLANELPYGEVLDRLEQILVAAIRRAAARNEGVGKSCMALTLTPNGEARTHFYPAVGTPRSYAPHFIWYSGGRNMVVGDVDILGGTGYDVVIGGDRGPFTLAVGMGASPERKQLPTDARRLGFHVRLMPAIHHLDAVIEEVNLVSIPRE